MVADVDALRLTLAEIQQEVAAMRASPAALDATDVLALLVRALLLVLDDDPGRPGLADTPDRVARAWQEFLSPPADRLDTAFDAVQTDQLIVLQGHRVWSMCEHHLLPFWCDVTIGYLPNAHVLGVSKLARIANLHAGRLQLQERLTCDLGKAIAAATGQPARGSLPVATNPHVAVLARGEHLCMAMRGVRSPSKLITSYLTGAFRDDPATRAEFFALANGHA